VEEAKNPKLDQDLGLAHRFAFKRATSSCFIRRRFWIKPRM